MQQLWVRHTDGEGGGEDGLGRGGDAVHALLKQRGALQMKYSEARELRVGTTRIESEDVVGQIRNRIN